MEFALDTARPPEHDWRAAFAMAGEDAAPMDDMVNQVQNEKELAALHRARDRGQPYGQDRWVQKTASALGIESSLRPPGRPKKGLLEKNGL